MSPAKKTTSSRAGGSKKSSAKKTTAKKVAARKTPAKKTLAKKTIAKKSTVKKAPAKKAPARKITRAAAAKTRAKAPARKTTTPAGKTPAGKTPAGKTPAKKTTARATGGAKKDAAAAPIGRRTGKPQFKTPIRKLPVKKTKPPRPAKLDKEALKRIREQLMGERGNLVKQQEELEEDSFEGSQSDLTGEVGLDEDFADAGTATFDRERDLSIRNNIRDLIDQIDRAVRRIDEGSYGTCERCGQPIDAARVKALPHTSLCLDCKRREERVR